MADRTRIDLGTKRPAEITDQQPLYQTEIPRPFLGCGVYGLLVVMGTLFMIFSIAYISLKSGTWSDGR